MNIKGIKLCFCLLLAFGSLSCSNNDQDVIEKLSIESVEIFVGQNAMKVGESVQLFAMISPEISNDANLFWSTTNPEIALVDQSGKVRALKSGSVYITVVSQSDLSVSDIIELNIVNQ